ncbi:hypothetical protein NP233_g4474 [Leucocoprinus birnbaumii]|uniref:Uncharacterized protein n=1 Tax=Leucocoprinus birnbaumii TaxID=56174 RepID=A0AAD5VUM5_9AGAR|nr:hypothetical protein NP233_g4474 [Leucocoprinus birnbaumii]
MDLEDGRYVIISAAPSVAPPPSPIGVDVVGFEEMPVVIYGSTNVWNVKRNADGNYHIVLDTPAAVGISSMALDNDVFADYMRDPFEWTVKPAERPWKGFTIQLIEGGKHAPAWTCHSQVHKSPISLRPIELMPTANQVFAFKRLSPE